MTSSYIFQTIIRRVSQDDLRFEINGSFLPSVWRALAALSPANMKLISELNPGVAAAAAHAGRNLAGKPYFGNIL